MLLLTVLIVQRSAGKTMCALGDHMIRKSVIRKSVIRKSGMKY